MTITSARPGGITDRPACLRYDRRMSLPTAFVGVLGCIAVIAAPFVIVALTPPVVTRAGFEALHPGMSFAAAERAIGRPGQETAIEETAAGRRRTVVWLNLDGSSVRADFEREALVSKTAERLP